MKATDHELALLVLDGRIDGYNLDPAFIGPGLLMARPIRDSYDKDTWQLFWKYAPRTGHLPRFEEDDDETTPYIERGGLDLVVRSGQSFRLIPSALVDGILRTPAIDLIASADGSGELSFPTGGGTLRHISSIVGAGPLLGGPLNILNNASDGIEFDTQTTGWLINGSGFLLPAVNNGRDIGSSSQRVKKFYTVDIDLSGEVTGDLIPATDSLYDLGSTGKRWASAWIDGMRITDEIVYDNPSANRTNLGLEIGTDVQAYSSLLAGIVSGGQQDLVSDPTGGTTVDTEARTAINAIIDALQALGLMAT